MINLSKNFSTLLVLVFGLMVLEGCAQMQNLQIEQEITQAID